MYSLYCPLRAMSSMRAGAFCPAARKKLLSFLDRSFLAAGEGFDLRCGAGHLGLPYAPRHMAKRPRVRIQYAKKSCPKRQDLFGSGRRIRTLTYGVRVRCATFTQSRYIANARVIIPNFRRMSSGIGKFSRIFFYFFLRQSMETLCPVRRKNKMPSCTGISSSRVSAAA